MNKSLIILAFTMSLAATTSTAALARSVLDDSISAAKHSQTFTMELARRGADDPAGDDRGGRKGKGGKGRGGHDDGPNHTSIIEQNPPMDMARRGADDPAGDDRGGRKGKGGKGRGGHDDGANHA
ncbi:hypothetical protein [Aestuariivirga sp.]|uniref:hypothetical protein n=1 Tax=Aestuariivirga sp. TaxID=2650926 RepID=UPI003593E1A9